MAVAAALSLVCAPDLTDMDDVQHRLLHAYRAWTDTRPFGLGQTCARALVAPRPPELIDHLNRVRVTNTHSRANGATMRASALIIAYHKTDEGVRDMARRDAELSHPNAFCVDANAAYASIVAAVIRGEAPVFETSNEEVRPVLSGWLPESAYPSMGWVAYGIGMACHFLNTGATFEEAMREVLARGGDTDTNAAIVGAALGAKYGLSALPERWVDAVIEPSSRDTRCRPDWVSPRGKLFVIRRLFSKAV